MSHKENLNMNMRFKLTIIILSSVIMVSFINIIDLVNETIQISLFESQVRRQYAPKGASENQSDAKIDAIVKAVADEADEPMDKAVETADTEMIMEEYPELTLLSDKNQDVCGWIMIEDTNINYPILQSEDNQFYLNHNVFKEESKQGAIFMDYRCEADFSSFNTILYGHNMKNETMFSNLNYFQNEAYFKTHKTAEIYSAGQKVELEIIAYLLVESTAPALTITVNSREERQNYFDYIQEEARYYREFERSEEDRFVTLSTCANGLKGMRSVVVCRRQ